MQCFWFLRRVTARLSRRRWLGPIDDRMAARTCAADPADIRFDALPRLPWA